MDATSRKAAVAAYKERKTPAGIYALRCAENGAQWVGHAPDLDAILNRLLFTLRMGGHRAAGLQEAFDRHGADALVFETLERFERDLLPEGEALKARLTHWRLKLDARPL